jgi:predicted peroxiredoxin
MRLINLTLIGLLLFSSVQSAFCAEAAKPVGTDTTVIHLSHFGDNLHAAVMALKISRAVLKHKVPVVLFLDLEGVRLADRRQPQELRWGSGEPISTYFNAFLKDGGKIMVCPHCASAAGLDAASLRENARIASDDELGELIAGASKIMDY